MFHLDIQTLAREMKIRRETEYLLRNSTCLDSRWNTVSNSMDLYIMQAIETRNKKKDVFRLMNVIWVNFILFEYSKSRYGELFLATGNPCSGVFTANHDVHETRLRAMLSWFYSRWSTHLHCVVWVNNNVAPLYTANVHLASSLNLMSKQTFWSDSNRKNVRLIGARIYQLLVRLIIDVFLFDLLHVRTVCCPFSPSFISVNCFADLHQIVLQGQIHTHRYVSPFSVHYT